MILLIDNYDSFVFNLARYVRELGREVQVMRNDAIDSAGIRDLNPTAIILSPGPCAPDQAGNCLDIVHKLSADFPILGVCLGHQVIAQAFGGKVARANHPLHGKTSLVEHDGTGVFGGLPNPFRVTRYHSLIAKLPHAGTALKATAHSPDGELMALAHADLPVYGVQFHPESVLTEHGHALLANFLSIAEGFKKMPAKQGLSGDEARQGPETCCG
ncbi:anthranilate synthase component II [Thalassospira mesophila]|uniref:Anthranilate synthase n=1 Tax=Thalassospira mesophila TaxID=1293891 RepID=A0A1Y2L132_9PROT|nr:aminodeoxychorismate/anthranilate synthase component II [Thalassospira mesophila]OSQ37774.1 anthranilate synthase [Thalassospira mesophila]